MEGRERSKGWCIHPLLPRCVSVNLHTNNPCSHANRGLHHPTGCISPPLPSHTRTERELCHTTHHHLPPPLMSARERAASPITHSPPPSRMQTRWGRVTTYSPPPPPSRMQQRGGRVTTSSPTPPSRMQTRGGRVTTYLPPPPSHIGRQGLKGNLYRV